MRIEPTHLDGAYVIHHAMHADPRGHFGRLFCFETFASAGLERSFPQTSISYNAVRGTLRGLHYQREPQAEVKLVTCVGGRIFDVIADVRQGSKTYGQWFGLELSGNPLVSLYVPKGLVHGFITREPGASVLYHISVPYIPELSAGIRWDDPTLAIDWPERPAIVSDRDRQLPFLGSRVSQ